MSRAELAAWTIGIIALVLHSAAKGQHPSHPGYYSGRYAGGPPVAETFQLAIDLSREAAAFAREAKVVLCDCDDYDDVLDELEDLCEELEDLHCRLREATNNPRKWRKVRKRADDVHEEVCELVEEVYEALRDLRRHQPRLTSFHPPIHRGYYATHRAVTQPQLVLRFGRGSELRLASSRPRFTTVAGPSLALPYNEFYENHTRDLVPSVTAPVDPGCSLASRAQRMHTMSKELVRLSRCR